MSGAHISTQGLVLREVNYKEADKILTVLTAEGGKRTVKARGCRRKGSPLAASAQLLVYSDMTLFEYRDHFTLNEAESLQQFWHMKSDVGKLSLASYFAEVMEAVAVEGRPDLFSGISPIVNMDRTSSAVRVDTKSYEQTTVVGVSETYAGMTGTTIARGRGIQFVDCDDAKKICVVGDYIDRVAYGGNALGQTIKIGENQYTIVGVAAAEVDDPTLQEGSNDDYIYIPYTTAQRVARNAIVSAYGVTTIDESRVAEGKAVLEAGLAELLHSENGQGYFVTSLSEMLDTFSSMIGMVVSVLTVIAAISLLVGGIGIMNIMMVSVAERTREIGIRKALGAKERTILALFVTEAATTSALGGLIGIVLGYGVSAAASPLVAALMGDTNMSISPSPSSVAVAFGVSVGIGVLFGYLPAKRAARLNPIEALRYD